MTFPTNAVEFGRAWSACAATFNTWSGAAKRVSDLAGQAFVMGNDREANTFRTLAKEFQDKADAAERELGAFIREDERRRAVRALPARARR